MVGNVEDAPRQAKTGPWSRRLRSVDQNLSWDSTPVRGIVTQAGQGQAPSHPDRPLPEIKLPLGDSLATLFPGPEAG